jgi:hypothetical protein
MLVILFAICLQFGWRQIGASQPGYEMRETFVITKFLVVVALFWGKIK